MKRFALIIFASLLSFSAQAQKTYTLRSDVLDPQAMYAVIFVDGAQQACIPVGTCSVTAPDANGDKFLISNITALVPPSLIFTVAARVCTAANVCSTDTVADFDCNEIDCEVALTIAPPPGLSVTED